MDASPIERLSMMIIFNGLYRYTGFAGMLKRAVVRTGIVVYFRKVPKFPKEKDVFFHINLLETREIEQYQIPRGNQICKHSLRKRKPDGRTEADVAVCKQCSFAVKLAGGTSNMSTDIKRHNRLHWVLVGNKRKTDTPDAKGLKLLYHLLLHQNRRRPCYI